MFQYLSFRLAGRGGQPNHWRRNQAACSATNRKHQRGNPWSQESWSHWRSTRGLRVDAESDHSHARMDHPPRRCTLSNTGTNCPWMMTKRPGRSARWVRTWQPSTHLLLSGHAYRGDRRQGIQTPTNSPQTRRSEQSTRLSVTDAGRCTQGICRPRFEVRTRLCNGLPAARCAKFRLRRGTGRPRGLHDFRPDGAHGDLVRHQ